MKVAVAKYRVGQPATFDAFAAHIRDELAVAAAGGAKLAVLPEYLSLELGATFAPAISGNLQASLEATQQYRAAWMSLFADIAREHAMHVIAGTFLLAVGDGRFRNRADWFGPDGRHGWQEKLQMTGFEGAASVIDGGDALHVFAFDDTRTERAAIAICYDAEFPLPVRCQVEAGARLLVVPSCTDTPAGATRVRIGCMARALESRCFVAQAVTQGVAPWSPALDFNTGEAAIFAPMDVGFPDDGILVQTRGEETWAMADLDFGALDATRALGQVANDADWPRQWKPALRRAVLTELR